MAKEENRLYVPITPNKNVVITKRYEFLYNLNDLLLALFWLAGSIFNLLGYTTIGSWIFITASIFFFIRPLIRILHKVKIKKIN